MRTKWSGMVRNKASDGVSCDPVDNRRQPTSRVDGVKLTTGSRNVWHWASHGRYATSTQEKTKLNMHWKRRLATRNVRGLRKTGKLEIVQKELKQCQIDIAGIAETHWRGKGHFTSTNYTVYFSGNKDRSTEGVALLVANEINKCWDIKPSMKGLYIWKSMQPHML